MTSRSSLSRLAGTKPVLGGGEIKFLWRLSINRSMGGYKLLSARYSL